MRAVLERARLCSTGTIVLEYCNIYVQSTVEEKMNGKFIHKKDAKLQIISYNINKKCQSLRFRWSRAQRLSNFIHVSLRFGLYWKRENRRWHVMWLRFYALKKKPNRSDSGRGSSGDSSANRRSARPGSSCCGTPVGREHPTDSTS